MRFAVIAAAILVLTIIVLRRPELVRTELYGDGSRVLCYQVGR
jgi:hypothetical protein